MDSKENEKTYWDTYITEVCQDNLYISGYKLDEIIDKLTLLETSYLLLKTELPSPDTIETCRKLAIKAALIEGPKIEKFSGEDVSKTIIKCMLADSELHRFIHTNNYEKLNMLAYTLGRFIRYIAIILGTQSVLDKSLSNEPLGNLIYRATTGNSIIDEGQARVIEAMIVACCDHGVTPPSTQACLVAASVRASYELAIANGIVALTDYHGGVGIKASEFYYKCLMKFKEERGDLEKSIYDTFAEYKEKKRRICGIGHRIHQVDPRVKVLIKIAEENGCADTCVTVAKQITDIVERSSGIKLPLNVGGLIGAIITDMGLPVQVSKLIFIYGRVTGLSAHYFEEISRRPIMRRINFTNAVYKGECRREL